MSVMPMPREEMVVRWVGTRHGTVTLGVQQRIDVMLRNA